MTAYRFLSKLLDDRVAEDGSGDSGVHGGVRRGRVCVAFSALQLQRLAGVRPASSSLLADAYGTLPGKGPPGVFFCVVSFICNLEDSDTLTKIPNCR